MKYFVKSAKYFIAFCVLYVGLVWLGTLTSSSEASVWEAIAATMQTTRGQLLAVAVVVLSALYPRFGYITRRVECDLVQDRDQIATAFGMAGFEEVERNEGEVVYRASGLFGRLFMLYEDRITVRQCGQWVEISGIRRSAARIAYRLESYMSNKRR